MINMQRYFVPLLVSVVLAMGFYGVSMLLSDFDNTVTSIKKLPLIGWLFILGLSLFNYIVRFLRWEKYIEVSSGKTIPIAEHVGIYLSGFSLTTTPGKAGEAIRSFYIQRHGVSLTQSLSTLFVERVVDFISMALLSILAAVYFEEYAVPLIIIGFVCVSVLPIIHSQTVLGVVARLGQKLPQKLAGILGQILKLIDSSAVLLKNRYLYGGLVIGLIAWGAEGYSFYLILGYLDIEAGVFLAISIYAIAVLIGALSFMPGGLGGTEAVMGVLLVAIGADWPSAVAATIICRIATLWFAVVIGFIAIGVLAKYKILPAFEVTGENQT